MTKQNPTLQKVWIWLKPRELEILEKNKFAIIYAPNHELYIFKRKPINEKTVTAEERQPK